MSFRLQLSVKIIGLYHLFFLFSAKNFRIALIRLHVRADKSVNQSRAANFIIEAAARGFQVIVLPECFNSPYGTKYFPEYCETIPGESTERLRQVAKETKTYVIGGKYVMHYKIILCYGNQSQN